MSYLARLKSLLAEKGPPREPTKPTKGASVSYVSSEGGPFLTAGRSGVGADCVVTAHGAEIEERAGMAADRVPALYLDAWGRMNCQKPARVSDHEWRRALNDAGVFLDQWGSLAADLQWSAGDVFDVPCAGRPGGLIWRLAGDRVEAIGHDHVRMSDGRVEMKDEDP